MECQNENVLLNLRGACWEASGGQGTGWAGSATRSSAFGHWPAPFPGLSPVHMLFHKSSLWQGLRPSQEKLRMGS